MTLNSGYNLYRYNLTEPPINWSEQYQNPQYQSSRGTKNAIGAYFFYSKKDTAIAVGHKAITTMEQKEQGDRNLYITKAYLTSDVNLLDLSFNEPWPELMLDKLDDNGIDVLTASFTHLNPKYNLAFIRDDYLAVKNAKQSGSPLSWDDQRRININSFFYGNSSHLGQCLTDYNNGAIFKSMLMVKGYVGYIFVEEVNDPTICLFNSDCLSRPETSLYNR